MLSLDLTAGDVVRAGLRAPLAPLPASLRWPALVSAGSGGQQQRVAVARALAPGPAVVLADEPTSELDAATRDLVVAQLRREAEAGALVLVATHDVAVARACDRRISLAAGRVLAS